MVLEVINRPICNGGVFFFFDQVKRPVSNRIFEGFRLLQRGDFTGMASTL